MDSSKEKFCKKISVYLDRIEELEDDSAEAVLLIDEGEDEYSGELVFPTNLLPEEISEGDYLTLKISGAENLRDVEKSAAENLRDVEKSGAENLRDVENSGAENLRDVEKSDAENLSAKFEKIDAETSDAILIINDKKIYFPANFLPEEISEGDYLNLEISRDAEKTNAALDEARQLLEELE